MPATQRSKDVRPLCFEHHQEMRRNPRFSNTASDMAQAIEHGCTVPDCLVRYNTSRGYFLLTESGSADEMEMVPKINCLLDGAPMYLAEIKPEKRTFRLWTCPQCGARRTNEEGLVGLASQDN